MSSHPQLDSGVSNPFMEDILSNPLAFVREKNTEVEQIQTPENCIILGKECIETGNHSGGTDNIRGGDKDIPSGREAEKDMRRPRTMAEAVAAYAGKKFLTKGEKRAAKRKKLNSGHVKTLPVDEDIGELVEKEEIPANSKLAEKSDSDLESISDSQYESASEYPSDISNARMDIALNLGNQNTKVKPLRLNETVISRSSLEEASDEADERDEHSTMRTRENEPTSSDHESEDSDFEEQSSDSDSESSFSEEDLGQDEMKSLRDDLKQDHVNTTNETGLKDTKNVKSDSLEYEEKQYTNSTPPTSPDDENKGKVTDESVTKIPKLELAHFYKLGQNPSEDNPQVSQRITKNWNAMLKLKPNGLLNYGVTCYMNSAIQAMVHIPALQQYLNDINAGKYDSILRSRCVSYVLADLSKRMWGFGDNSKRKKPKYINPKRIIQCLDDINCTMSVWQQEDSHEYFMSLMSRLQEDSTPKGHKLNTSIIYDIFGGLLHQRVTCKKCNNISDTKQEFYDLSLGFNKRRNNLTHQNEQLPKYSIEKSIQDFFSNELIKIDKGDKSSGYYCEKCKERTNASKISTIDKAPETLTVHLKRFKFDGNSSSKMKQPISYPQFLDLTKYTTNNDPTMYQLIAVIVHEGRSILSGHYVAHCLQPDGTWSTYDDEYINKINEKEALSDTSAYVLVYSKLVPKTRKRRIDSNTNRLEKHSKI